MIKEQDNNGIRYTRQRLIGGERHFAQLQIPLHHLENEKGVFYMILSFRLDSNRYFKTQRGIVNAL